MNIQMKNCDNQSFAPGFQHTPEKNNTQKPDWLIQVWQQKMWNCNSKLEFVLRKIICLPPLFNYRLPKPSTPYTLQINRRADKSGAVPRPHREGTKLVWVSFEKAICFRRHDMTVWLSGLISFFCLNTVTFGAVKVFRFRLFLLPF